MWSTTPTPRALTCVYAHVLGRPGAIGPIQKALRRDPRQLTCRLTIPACRTGPFVCTFTDVATQPLLVLLVDPDYSHL